MWFFCHADGRKIWRGDTSTPSRMAETMSLLVREAEFQRHMRRCADRLAARGAAHGRGGPHVCGQFGDSWVTFGEAFGEALGGAFGNQKTPWFLIGTIRKVRGRREAPNARRPVTLDTYKTIATIMAIMAIMERAVIPRRAPTGARRSSASVARPRSTVWGGPTRASATSRRGCGTSVLLGVVFSFFFTLAHHLPLTHDCRSNVRGGPQHQLTAP